MSAILKALKKLEKESPPPDTSVTWPHPIDTRKIITRQLRYRRFKQVILSVFAVVFLTLCIWLISKSPLIETLRAPEVKLQVLLPKEGVPHSVENTSSGSMIDEKTDSQTVRKQVRKPLRSQTQSSDSKLRDIPHLSNTPARKETQSIIHTAEQDAEPIAIIKPLEPEMPEQEIPVFGNIAPSAPDTPENTQCPEEPYEDNENLSQDDVDSKEMISEDSEQNIRFKLQAIVWSEETSGRVAVINDKILRTGDSIDGVLIERISSEYVILKEDNDKWKLSFPLK